MNFWRREGPWLHLAAALGLAAFVAVLYYPLLFTNRVLATGDILLYFYPYRDYAAEALRAGRVPFWNPYLFGGAPFLANPQAAVLYPLHWPLSWLPATQQVYWSAALHTWLLGMGGYALLRRWGAGAAGGLAAAVVLSGAGLVGGLLGHLNQLNVAAWGLWAVLCVEGAYSLLSAILLRGIALAFMVALMLLAGHTQTVYIVLFGLGIWCLWPLVEKNWRETLARLAVYSLGVLLGALLSAPQLLPTLELSGLGLRTGGLSYLDATSFSLKPLQLVWTLLPTYGLLSLESLFDTPAYTEFVAYIGLLGLALAGLGAWQGRGRPRAFGLLFVVLGLTLGLGRWNPLYFVLHAAAPGFDLFRVPARWMLLYTYGAAVLGGLGAQWLLAWLALRIHAGPRTAAVRRPRFATWAGPLLLLGLLAGDLLLAARALPHTHPTAPEAVDGLRSAPAHLLTDPARAAGNPAAAGRFLGLSTITFDPGDMSDYQRIMLEGNPPQLDARTFADLVIAQKVQELLVPNLALLWRLPSIDGFDGGVLPLQRYNTFAQLLIPPDEFVPDGRLREQLQSIPPAGLLNLMNVQYLITDKVRDLWFEDVYYDRQIGARLTAARPTTELAVSDADFLQATHLDLIATAAAPAEVWAALADAAAPIATVTVSGTVTGPVTGTQIFTITAGGAPGAQVADGALDSPLAQASGTAVAFRDAEAGREEYRVRLPFATPFTPAAIDMQLLDNRFTLAVTAATLYDARTGMFTALLPSDRGDFSRVHSGDVKIYANQDLQPRAYLATRTLAATGPEDAAAQLRAQLPADPAGNSPGNPGDGLITVVEGLPPLGSEAADEPRSELPATAEIVAYAPERVEVRTSSPVPAVLVLADAFYPGWRAVVDGAESPIYAANVLFRGVPLDPGEHTIIFTYEPAGWRLGLALAAGGVLLLVLLGALAWWSIRRQGSRAV